MNFGFPIGFVGAAGAAALVTPTFFAQGAQATAGFADVTPVLPTGWAAGDLHVAVVMGQRSSAMGDTTSPVGWTRQSTLTITSGQLYKVEIHWRVAAGGDGNPTFDTSIWNTPTISAVVLGFRNCRIATPFESYSHVDVTSSDTTPSYASITTDSPNQRVVNLFINAFSTGTPDVGWTEEFDFATGGGPSSVWQLDSREMLTPGLASGTHTLSGAPGFCYRIAMALVPIGG